MQTRRPPKRARPVCPLTDLGEHRLLLQPRTMYQHDFFSPRQMGMMPPGASPLASIFNVQKARPGSARSVMTRANLTGPPMMMPLSARPGSARTSTPRAFTPSSMGSPRGAQPMSPRGAGMMTPRGAASMLSPRSLNEAGANVTEWLARQEMIRDMLGSAKERVDVQVSYKKQQQMIQQRNAPAKKPPPPKMELPHHRVWREREAKINARTQAMEARREAAALAMKEWEEAEMARNTVRAPLNAQTHPLGGEMVRAQAKLKEWFCEENSRFRRIFRAMDDVRRPPLRPLRAPSKRATHCTRKLTKPLLVRVPTPPRRRTRMDGSTAWSCGRFRSAPTWRTSCART